MADSLPQGNYVPHPEEVAEQRAAAIIVKMSQQYGPGDLREIADALDALNADALKNVNLSVSGTVCVADPDGEPGNDLPVTWCDTYEGYTVVLAPGAES